MTLTDNNALARPDQLLEGVGSIAWQAYNAMETTKRRHFDLLEVLDNKKKNYNLSPSDNEQRLLACLLKDHDQQVKRFTEASLVLKNFDTEAHLSLFAYIGGINHATEERQVTH